MLNGLDLFSGIGGLSLALQPWVRTVCYVEIEPYCQRVLQARIADGQLDDAPIWDDVRSFDPAPWRGAVDIVSGGFPCQDISTAGRGAGLEGERSGLFREIGRIAGAIRPAFIYLENVAAIVAPGRGGWDVVGALAALGYDTRWGVLSAYDVGAPHLRERWWCLAHAGQSRGQGGGVHGRNNAAALGTGPPSSSCADGAPVAHATGERERPGRRKQGVHRSSGLVVEGAEPWGHADNDGAPVAHAQHGEHDQRESADGPPDERSEPGRPEPGPGGRGAALAHAGFSGRGTPQSTGHEPQREAPGREKGAGGADECGWWAVEPDVGRVADGVPARVDRLRGLGNAVVPASAREAFARLLTGEGVTT